MQSPRPRGRTQEKPMRFRLAAKVILLVFVTLFLGMAVTTFYVVRSERKILLQKGHLRVEGINRRLFQSLVSIMALGMTDPEAIHKAVERMRVAEKNRDEVLEVRLIHAPGMVEMFRNEDAAKRYRIANDELPGDEMEMRALSGETIEVETLLIKDGKNSRVVKYVTPIRAEKECLSCHRVKEGGVMAAFSTAVSLEPVYLTLRERTTTLLLLWGAGFAVIFAALYCILQRVVIRPVLEVSETARAIAREGDLSRRVGAAAADEIGEMAASFNKMVEDLQKTTVDIAELKRVEEELRENRNQSRALSQKLISMQEEERARLSRELHDQLGKQLTALSLETEWVLRQPAPSAAQVGTLAEMIENTTVEMRRICKGLRPTVLDDMGLAPALKALVREFEDMGNFKIESSISPVEQGELYPETAICVYRVFQEALTNAVKHSNAKNVFVSFRKEGTEVVLIVHDDGSGFSDYARAGDRGLGLMGMRERGALCGGTVEMGSQPGMGTTVTMRAPVRNNI